MKAFIDGGAGERTWQSRILTIDGIIAPKTARGQRGDENAFGWEAKDFLRSQLMFSLRPKFLAYTEFSRADAPKSATIVRSQGVDIQRLFCKICILDDDTGNPDRNVDLAELMVKNGWCEVKLRRNDEPADEYMQNLNELQNVAMTQKVGMFSLDATDDAWQEKTRMVEWILNRRDNRNKALDFYEMAKGRELDAIVDSVREGAMIRLEILPDEKITDRTHRMAFVNLFGIKSPSIPMRFEQAKMIFKERQQAGTARKEDAPQQKNHIPEKFAVLAKEHTEIRMLGMKVKLRLEFCDDRGNLYGQVFLVHMGKKLDIAPSLVHKGLAVVVPWQAKMRDGGGKDLFAAQMKARKQKLNIWGLPDPAAGCPTLKSLLEANMSAPSAIKVGRVVNVRGGDFVQIKLSNTGEIKDFYLASLRAYRYGFGPMENTPVKGGRAADNEVWKRMSAAREFVREMTIAKDRDVKIEEEYTRQVKVNRRGKDGKTVEMMETRQYASLFVNAGGKELNIGVELCKAGFAENLSYDIKNQERSKHWAELLDATNIAKKEGKGYHDEKFSEDKFLDLTIRAKKGQNTGPNFQAVLEQLWQTGLQGTAFPAQVEYVFTGHKVKVIIDDKKIFKRKEDIEKLKSGVLGKTYCRYKAISVFLEGVRCKPAEQKDIAGYGTQAKNFVTDLIGQRTVWVTINQFRRNNFLGNIQFQENGRGKKKKLNEELVSRGFAEVMSFGKMPGQDILLKLQEQAREARLAIWANYQPEVPAEEEVQLADPTTELKEFKGTVTHVESGAVVYVVIDDNEDARMIQTELQSVKTGGSTPGKVEKTKVYAGLYDGEFYRCKVERASPDGIVVNFIDFGNSFKLKQDQLRMLSSEVASKPPLAKKVNLAFLDPPPRKNDTATFNRAGQKISQLVMNQKVRVSVLKRQPHKPPHVEMFLDSTGRSVNEEMTELGLLQIDKRQVKYIKPSETEQFKYINQLQEKARRARIKRLGIYQFGDPDESDEDDMFS